MDTTSVCRAWPVLLLAACLLIAGCFETDRTAAPTQTVTAAATLYAAGDIVRSPTGSESPAWLVISYDPAADSYLRALIYKNPDGSYGYRTNTATETSQRDVMEKVFTVKITHVTVASVPTAAPLTVTTAVTTTAARTTAATATTTAPRAPAITGIIPDEGYAGTNVSIRNLAGENFVVGATIKISRNASTIPATDVRYISNKSLICTFVIPSDATAGSWDVTVTNPDGKSDTFTNIFTVRRDASVVTTTSGTFSGSVPITAIDPSFASSTGRYEFTVTGSKFQLNGVTRVKLKKDGKADIVADTVVVNSATQIRFFVNIPTGSMGFWDIVITNPDNAYGRWNGALEIRG